MAIVTGLVGEVDVVVQPADTADALGNKGVHVLATPRPHAQLNQAIGKKNPCARPNFASQARECCRDQLGRTQDILRSNRHARARLEQHRLMALQAAGADFRPLQILQDAGRPAFLARCPTDPVDVAGVLFVGPV